MDKWLINGHAGDTIGVTDRGFYYGDGLFETIAIRNGEPRLLTRHTQRLTESCQRLGITIPSVADIASEISTLAEGLDHGVCKVIITRGPGQRGYKATDGSPLTRAVGVAATDPHPDRFYNEGIAIRYCSTSISRNAALAGMKTLNRLEQVLARNEWDDPQIFEGLMSDESGNLICGTMSNLFVVKGDSVITPDLLQSGIAGVMRGLVLDVCKEHGIEVTVDGIGKQMMQDADEVFLTNSNIGIVPVSRIAGGEVSTPGARPVTDKLRRLLIEQGVAEGGTIAG